jgi:transcriptional regulator with XRE-family HTH domain
MSREDRLMTNPKDTLNPLRRWRLQHKVAVATAAARIGVSASILKEWEAGSVTPRPERFERIAALMGTDAEALRRAWERWERQVQIKS